jgi:peptide/nickel transport system ATP-binding protein
VPSIEVRELCVELAGKEGSPVVDDISFDIEAGQIVGLAGETGSGKSTIANAMAGHARHGARIVSGSVTVDGVNLLALSEPQLEPLRGSVVTFVPQDPSASLNPALRIGAQMHEMFEYHHSGMAKEERRRRLQSMLREVGLPDSREFLRRYPHQLSGGQEQRVLLAMAFLPRPRLVIMDEPTTGLDVSVQRRILGIVRELCDAHRAAVFYVTHDLAVLSELADRVLIAYAGRLVEDGPREAVFAQPAHPYTRQLLAAIPEIAERRALRSIPGSAPAVGHRPAHCAFAPRCTLAADRCWLEQPAPYPAGQDQVARCFRLAESRVSIVVADTSIEARSAVESAPLLSVDGAQTSYGRRQVLFDAAVQVSAGETVALVGESGSGKTTLAKTIMGIVPRSSGDVTYDGDVLAADFRRRAPKARREIQYIYQSPFRALNPRRTVGDSIRAPLEQFGIARGRELSERVGDALDQVAMPRSYATRYPEELSGGERQRVAIARALACNPCVLICDEVTSALDVSVQAAVIELLRSLQAEGDLAILFITHNLALVRSIATRVVVMTDGRVVEEGRAEHVLTSPQAAYTQGLIRDTPSLHMQRTVNEPASSRRNQEGG